MNEGSVSNDCDDFAFLVGFLWRITRLCSCGSRHPVFNLEDVSKRQGMGSMNDLKELLDQMTVNISNQAFRLDNVRLWLFLNWLNTHGSKVQSALVSEQTLMQIDGALLQQGDFEDRLRFGLETWFESLPVQGLLWGHHLILIEIAWWHNLNAHGFNMILKPKVGK